MSSVVVQIPFNEYVANGLSTTFAYTFQTLETADLKVYADSVLVAASSYTVNGIGAQTGGAVIFSVAPLNGVLILVSRDVALARATEYQTLGDFKASVVNPDFNRLWMALQEQFVHIERSIRAPFPLQLNELPGDPASFEGYYFGVGAGGHPTFLLAPSGTAAALAGDLINTGTAAKGDALIGYSAVYSIVDGALTRHASLTAAVATLGATRATLVVRDDISLSSNTTIPATCELRVDNGAIVTLGAGITLTVNGRFTCGLAQCFTGSGKVSFARGSIETILPEWYGAKADAAIDASSGTDSTAGLAAAIVAATLDAAGAVAMHTITLTSGNYLTGNQILPPATTIYGTGRQTTNLVAKTGTVGKWITDNGSASKIILQGFAMYGHGVAGITHCMQLGRNGVEHGTEGYLKDLWLRDCSAAGTYGLDVLSNVGIYDNITCQNNARNIRIGGSPSHCSEFVSMQPTEVGADIGYCTVNGLHIEAPSNACIPLLLGNNAQVSGLSISLANSTTISHLIEFGAGATTWSIDNFMLFFGSTPAGVTVSNGNMKRSDGTYFGGNATAGSLNGQGNYSSSNAGEKLQSFTVRITNTAGTLQHRISSPSGNAVNFASAINGASATLTNTPTGADGSTAFATGAKIGSASPSVLWLDTISQKEADHLLLASISFNSTTTALTVVPFVSSININGVTRTRLGLQFFDLTGTAFSISTANITAGKIVQVTFLGWIAN